MAWGTPYEAVSSAAAAGLMSGEPLSAAEESPPSAADDERLVPRTPAGLAAPGGPWRRAFPLALGCGLVLAAAAAWAGRGAAAGGAARARRPQRLRLVSEAKEEAKGEEGQGGNFVVHEGLNCVNGFGADAFGDENGAEGEIDGRSEFTLDECKQECGNRMPVCEAFIVITDGSNSRCWLRTNITAESCYEGTPYNLWVWDPDAAPDSTEASTTEAPTTEAPATAAPASEAAVTTAAQAAPEPTTTAAAATTPAAATTQGESVFDVDAADGAPEQAGEESSDEKAGAGLWDDVVPNQFCKNRDMDDSVADRVECQAKCGDGCAGIAYSDKAELSQYCYLCRDDQLISSANEFHFYRAAPRPPGEAPAADQPDALVATEGHTASEDEPIWQASTTEAAATEAPATTAAQAALDTTTEAAATEAPATTAAQAAPDTTTEAAATEAPATTAAQAAPEPTTTAAAATTLDVEKKHNEPEEENSNESKAKALEKGKEAKTVGRPMGNTTEAKAAEEESKNQTGEEKAKGGNATKSAGKGDDNTTEAKDLGEERSKMVQKEKEKQKQKEKEQMEKEKGDNATKAADDEKVNATKAKAVGNATKVNATKVNATKVNATKAATKVNATKEKQKGENNDTEKSANVTKAADKENDNTTDVKAVDTEAEKNNGEEKGAKAAVTEKGNATDAPPNGTADEADGVSNVSRLGGAGSTESSGSHAGGGKAKKAGHSPKAAGHSNGTTTANRTANQSENHSPSDEEEESYEERLEREIPPEEVAVR